VFRAGLKEEGPAVAPSDRARPVVAVGGVGVEFEVQEVLKTNQARHGHSKPESVKN